VRVTGPTLEQLDRRGDEFAALVRREVTATLKHVASRVRSVDDLITIRTQWAIRIDQRLADHVMRVWRESADDTWRQLHEHALTAAISIPRVVQSIADFFRVGVKNRLRDIGDLVWNVAREQMIEGNLNGESIDQIRDRIVATTDIALPRAEVIARNEVMAASEAGSYAQMTATTLDATKEWLATHDGHTRPTHVAVNGEVVDMRGKFTVGGYPMDRPHDPTAPPGETINCRCTLIWDIPDDEFLDYDDTLAAAASPNWTPGKHPRDSDGKFAKTPGGASSKSLKITHALIHKKHEPGTVIAINKTGDKRAVWGGMYYNLQRKQPNGEWTVEETAIKTKAYNAIKAFDTEWFTPDDDDDSAAKSSGAPSAGDLGSPPGPSGKSSSAGALGKQVKITHAFIHKKREPGTVTAVSGDQSKRVVWDGTQYNLQHKRSSGEWQTDQTAIKTKAYVAVNAYAPSWFEPGDEGKTATTNVPTTTSPGAPSRTSPSAKTPGKPLKITHALVHKKRPAGTTLATNKSGDKRIVWEGDRYSLQSRQANGEWQVDQTAIKTKAYDAIKSYDAEWFEPGDDNGPTAAQATTPAKPKKLIDDPMPMAGFTKVGGKQGSQQGGSFIDPNGDFHYVKASKSGNHAKNEVLANKLYELAGVRTPDVELVKLDDASFPGKNGALGTKSRIITGDTNIATRIKDPEFKRKFYEGFAADAWLANWDVVGLGYDNVITDKSGEPARIDSGGALLFRAQGTPKGSSFGDTVTEINTLRNPALNAQSAKIFADITDEDIRRGVAKIEAITPKQIDDMVDAANFSSGNTSEELKTKLKARRQDLINRYGSGASKQPSAPGPSASTKPVTSDELVKTIAPTTPAAPAAPTTSAPLTTSPTVPKSPLTSIANVKPMAGYKRLTPPSFAKGAVFADPNGDEVYVRSAPSQSAARNTLLASKLYQLAGVDVPDAEFVAVDNMFFHGKTNELGTQWKHVQGLGKMSQNMDNPQFKSKLYEDFAIDAWLGNTEVGGYGENIIADKPGHPVRTDPSGSLLYRADGSPKGLNFGDAVTETSSLRDKTLNPIAAKIYADITDDDIRKGVKKIEAIEPHQINQLVDAAGFTGATAAKLKQKLTLRRQDLIDRYITGEKPIEPVLNMPTPVIEKKYPVDDVIKTKAIFQKHSAKASSPGKKMYDAAFEVSKTHPGLTMNDALNIMDQSDKGGPTKPFYTKVHAFLETPGGKKHALLQSNPTPKPTVSFTPLPRELTEADANELQKRMNVVDPPPINGAQRAALKKYTGPAYVQVNNCLRGTGYQGCTEGTRKTIAQINAAMKTSTDDIVLYRKTTFNSFGVYVPEKLDEMVGKTITDKGVMSTSIKNGIWSGNVHIEIDAPKGSRMAWLKELSYWPDENEMALAPGTQFKIISSQPHPDNPKDRVVKLRVVVEGGA
jgi:hypothetical protein